MINNNNKTYYKYNFTDLSDYLYYYSSFFNDSIYNNDSYEMIGPIRIRFFNLNNKLPCSESLNFHQVNLEPLTSVKYLIYCRICVFMILI